MLVVGELFFGDFAALEHRAVFADLLERQEVGARIHDAARDEHGRDVDAPDRHQKRRYGFVAACEEHAAVERRRVCVDLDEVGDDVARGQRVVDAVVALRHAVADVGREIERGLAARAVGAGLRLLRETQKVRGARVALSVGAFN